MAFPTASDILVLEEAIRAAIANGSWQVQTIQFSDQSMTLRSLNEAMDLLAKLNVQLVGSVRTRYAAHDKGV